MAAQKEIETVIDIEDESDDDSDVVIDNVGKAVAEIIIDMGDDKDDDEVKARKDAEGTEMRRRRRGEQRDVKRDVKVETGQDDEGGADDDEEGEANDEEDAADDEGDANDNEEDADDEGLAREIMRALWEHLRQLLENFTAHGFNHLLIRREDGTYNVWMIVMWAGAIFVAFFASAFYIASSVREAEKNPIIQTIGYIRAQVRQFGDYGCNLFSIFY